MSKIRDASASGSAGGPAERSQGHPIQVKASKEDLLDRLADLCLQVGDDGTGSKCAELDDVLAQLERLEPPPDGPSAEESLERFHERYAAVFDVVSAEEGIPRPRGRGRRGWAAKLFPIAAVIALLLGTATAQAFGLFSAIANWTAEIFQLDSGEEPYATVRLHPLKEGETATYESLEEAVAAFGIDVPIVPREIPERFELTDVTATQWKDGARIVAHYQDGYDFLKIAVAETVNFDGSSLEKEPSYVRSCLSGGITHYLLSDLGRWKFVWGNGELECQLTGSVSEQEIIEMIHSIYGE